MQLAFMIKDTSNDDAVEMILSMLVEMLWFFVGFVILRYGLLSRVVPQALATSISRSGFGFLLGQSFQQDSLTKAADKKAAADEIQPDKNCALKKRLVGNAMREGDVQNYMCLLRTASREGDLPKAFSLLNELESIRGDGLDVAVYNSVIDACVVKDEMAKALKITEKLEKSNVANAVSYNILVKGYCSKGDLHSAKATIQRMIRLGLSPDSASYNCIVGAFAQKGDVRSAWKILAEMKAQSISIDCYTASIMMTAAKKARDPRDAEQALALLDRPEISPCQDHVLFNTVLDACISCRNSTRLAQALHEYEGSSMNPSVHTYGLLIKAYSTLKRLPKCMETWSEMVDQRGLQPNVITFSCMLDALISAGSALEAVSLFRQWESKVPPNIIMYATVLKAFASIGDADGAMNLFRELKAKGNGVKMNSVAYTTLIDAHVKAGYMEAANELLVQMERDGCEPNTITYSILVKGACAHGDVAGALKLFGAMRARGLKADVVIFNTLLDGCIRHSHFQLAEQLLEDIPKYEIKPSNFTLSVIIKMWVQRQQIERAIEAVRTFASGIPLDARIGSSIVSACLNAGNVERAVEFVQEMKTWKTYKGPDANIYGLLITALVRHQRFRLAAFFAEEACKVLDPVKAAETLTICTDSRRGRVRGNKPRHGLLSDLFKGLTEEPRLMQDIGHSLIATMQNVGLEIPDDAIAFTKHDR